MYAEVIVLRNTGNIDNTYTYHVPDQFFEQIDVGSRVIVPFGPNYIEGVVKSLVAELDSQPSYQIKSLSYVFTDGISLNRDAMNLVSFIKDTYLCSYTEAVQLMLPSGTMTKQHRLLSLMKTPEDSLDLSKLESKIIEKIGAEKIKEEDLYTGYAEKSQKYGVNRLIAMGIIRDELAFESIVKDRYVEWIEALPSLEVYYKSIPNHYKAQLKLAQHMLENKKELRLDVQEKLKISKNVIDRMVQLGHLKVTLVEDLRKPDFMISHSDKSQIKLSAEQQQVYSEILDSYFKEGIRDFLLYGITGSGKTEVYAELIESVVKSGKRAILMVPEIALTPQIVSRFSSRFGAERIALVHSKVSQGEKHDQWKQIKAGKFDLIIGARSAIFSPVENLGLIIMDESHENTYRSEKRPKYDTYEVARFLADKHNALLISGSATPSIVEYHSAVTKKRKLLKLESRFNQSDLPDIEVVDMREELAAGNRSILSNRLHEAIEERLEKKEQTIIFLNRKGHSTFVSCRSCGFTLACPHCDVTLTFFKGEKSVRCNYCGYETFVPKQCPECNSTYFKYFGVGTEKVEEQLNNLFPTASIDRMDRTTTSKKGSVEKILSDIETNKTDILIGTQMVAKGFDFKKITLIGILSADLLLNFPSYQSSERAYQLFNQVAGRAGRGDLKGEVILQTYVPDHYAINQPNYESFYAHEIEFRRNMNYPPFTRIVNLLFSSKDDAVAQTYAIKSRTYLNNRILKNGLQNEIELYDANPALLKKIDGQYRWQVLIKTKPEHMPFLRQYIKNLEIRFSQEDKCKLNVDLNAVNIL